MPPHPATPTNDPAPTQPQDRAFYRAVLHEMINAGIDLVRTIELRAVNATVAGDAPALDAALSFERITRAVRRSIMLAEKIAEPPTTSPPTPTSPQPPPPPNRGPTQTRERDRPESPDTEDDEEFDHDRAPDSPAPDAPTHETPTHDTEDNDGVPDDALAHHTIPVQIAAIRRDLAPNRRPTRPEPRPIPPAQHGRGLANPLIPPNRLRPPQSPPPPRKTTG